MSTPPSTSPSSDLPPSPTATPPAATSAPDPPAPRTKEPSAAAPSAADAAQGLASLDALAHALPAAAPAPSAAPPSAVDAPGPGVAGAAAAAAPVAVGPYPVALAPAGLSAPPLFESAAYLPGSIAGGEGGGWVELVGSQGAMELGGGEAGMRRTGRCKFFNAQKGFGFVLDHQAEELGNDEVFVHYTAISAVQGGTRGFRSLLEVEYSIVQGPKGWQAQDVTGPNGAPCIGTPPGSGKLSLRHAPPLNPSRRGSTLDSPSDVYGRPNHSSAPSHHLRGPGPQPPYGAFYGSPPGAPPIMYQPYMSPPPHHPTGVLYSYLPPQPGQAPPPLVASSAQAEGDFRSAALSPSQLFYFGSPPSGMPMPLPPYPQLSPLPAQQQLDPSSYASHQYPISSSNTVSVTTLGTSPASHISMSPPSGYFLDPYGGLPGPGAPFYPISAGRPPPAPPFQQPNQERNGEATPTPAGSADPEAGSAPEREQDTPPTPGAGPIQRTERSGSSS
ncbi:SPOSA6832_00048 [Sporobolomyces salmonicolor]|uniref:SPOSA6832_00048-mRNA-1:cds n=1 Tax=Sporidiobolus salmonicolor TaxID=5005 RepID=A0A0D6EFC7_SPOSA|nr:SPOSA6832_00048 [Sporobolomyces salmonicolor]